MNDIIDFIHTNRDRYVDELKAYLAIPSISALPQHADDVRRCAEWTADEIAYGIADSEPKLLRPLRRAARRSSRALGIAAI